MMRTDRAGDLRATDIGRDVVVCGWVDSRRDHGVRVGGPVRARPEGTVNDALPTGEVEVAASALEVLSEADTPTFPIDDRIEADEVLRLRHRYLDLRRPRLQRNLRIRARVN